MVKNLLFCTIFLLMPTKHMAQQVSYQEYDLKNGLHVILHQDNTAPIVITSIMYHVGGKDRTEGRTGFAHLFEHLLFEGTRNIERGKWFEIVASHGGYNNANTTQDRTYYFEIFPSNNLELGLWMESERLLHPVINQIGLETQQKVVKEEKRLRYDNKPYGQLLTEAGKALFKKHPYKDPNIGYMEDLDAATLEDVVAYHKKYYVPNNAVLVVAGDLEYEKTKGLIEKYFGPIPKGKGVDRTYPREDPIAETIRVKAYDKNIQMPASVVAYRTPGFAHRDSFVLNMIFEYLSGGNSSPMVKNLVDAQKLSPSISYRPVLQEDYSIHMYFSKPQGATALEAIESGIEEEMVNLRQNLISEREYQKVLNKIKIRVGRANSTLETIANELANYYLLYGNTALINETMDIYNSITREEMREVARKYLNPQQRALIHFLPHDSHER